MAGAAVNAAASAARGYNFFMIGPFDVASCSCAALLRTLLSFLERTGLEKYMRPPGRMRDSAADYLMLCSFRCTGDGELHRVPAGTPCRISRMQRPRSVLR